MFFLPVWTIQDTLWWSNIAIENPPFEDYSRIGNGDFHCCVRFLEGATIISLVVGYHPLRAIIITINHDFHD